MTTMKQKYSLGRNFQIEAAKAMNPIITSFLRKGLSPKEIQKLDYTTVGFVLAIARPKRTWTRKSWAGRTKRKYTRRAVKAS